MLLEMGIIFLLILINGIFSMSEIALVSSRKSKLEAESEQGNKKAKTALDLANAPDYFFSTVQVGITLVGILTGVFGGASTTAELAEYIRRINLFPEYSSSLALAIVVISITFFTLIFGELLPKRIAISNPEKIAMIMSQPMILLSKFVSPVVWILSSATNLFGSLFGIRTRQDNFVTEEEIKVMLDQASDVGQVEKVERDIVERVFFLGDAEIKTLMTNKIDVIFLNVNEGMDTLMEKISTHIHTHYPAYEDESDNIIGVLNVKKLVKALYSAGDFNFRSLLDEPLFVPETLNAYKLLETMKNADTPFAIAIDEYGAVKGIITNNDLFKAIVGNLYTETKAPSIVQREDGSYLADGLMSLEEFFGFFRVEVPETLAHQGFMTLGGLLLYIATHIPEAGEIFAWENFKFEIMDMDGTRVDKILVKTVPAVTPANK